ncbi:MAG TPA: hypothetical protein VG937_06700 [Polyangiaceae bacterium]|nr:hypothetical protein [Polyangiaceae bacterium]
MDGSANREITRREQLRLRLTRLGIWLKENKIWAATLMALAVCWVAIHQALVPYLVEDSYIHFRVAENLARHGAPYFNPGEAVKTSSSTPWTLLLASHFLFVPRGLRFVAFSASLISVFGLLSFLALVKEAAGRRLLRWEIALLALVYLAVVQVASVMLMETPLALALATAGLHAYLRRRPWCFALFALTACTRPELVVLAGIVTLAAVVDRSMNLKRCAAWAAAGALPICVFDLIAYRTIVPHAALAKPLIHTYPFAGTFMLTLPEALRDFHLSVLIFIVYGVAYVVLATLPLLRLNWSRSLLRDRGVQLMLITSLAGLVIVGGYLYGRSLIFPWYRPLYMYFLFLPAVFYAARSGKLAPYLALVGAALPLLYDLGGTALALVDRPQEFRHFLEGARARHTHKVAAQLARAYPGAVMMTSEIGAVGFGFDGHVEDAVGIASPGALKYHPLAVPEDRNSAADAPVPRALVRDQRPGLLMAVDVHLDPVLRDPIRNEYVHVRHDLYEPADEQRRLREDLLWQNVRYLDVLVRRDLWQSRKGDGKTAR